MMDPPNGAAFTEIAGSCRTVSPTASPNLFYVLLKGSAVRQASVQLTLKVFIIKYHVSSSVNYTISIGW